MKERKMKYKINGIKNSIEVDFNDKQFLINNKKYNLEHILYVSYCPATTHQRGHMFILLDDFQVYKVEFIYSQYSDMNETAKQIYEKLKPHQERIKAYLYAKYYGGSHFILHQGIVLIVLFENELVIRKGNEEYRTSYDDITSLSFSIDKNTILEDNSYPVFNYFFFGLEVAAILNSTQKEMVTKYNSALTICSQSAGKIILYSPAMNDLYNILSEMTNNENVIDKEDGVLQYKVEYLKLSDSKQDAIDLEILLNQYATDNWNCHKIIDKKDHLLVIFHHRELR